MAATIRTARLDLLPCNVAALSAELDGAGALAAALGVRVPREWPPELYDGPAMEFGLVVAQHTPPVDLQWLFYWVVLRDDAGQGPTAVGIAGFKGPPDEGEVEIGYSLLEAYRRRGIATEAVRALLAHAFGDARVERVVAETMPDLASSIGVLEKCAFRLLGEGSDEGALRFGLSRQEWEARAVTMGAEGRS